MSIFCSSVGADSMLRRKVSPEMSSQDALLRGMGVA